MTGALDKKMRATAERLVDKFGKAITLRRTTSTFDPSTGTTSESTTDHSVNAVIEPYAERLIDGSLIQVGDMQVTVPAKSLSIDPDTSKDSVILDSVEWTLVRVEALYSGEQVATWALQVRR